MKTLLVSQKYFTGGRGVISIRRMFNGAYNLFTRYKSYLIPSQIPIPQIFFTVQYHRYSLRYNTPRYSPRLGYLSPSADPTLSFSRPSHPPAGGARGQSMVLIPRRKSTLISRHLAAVPAPSDGYVVTSIVC